MIVRMSGIVAEVHEGLAVLERNGLAYEVMVCGYAVGELTACQGREVTLHTLEYYEGSSAGGNLIPRIVGFLHPEDRAFFSRFITVKGMGVRRAIKALAEPIGRVAAAIEEGDELALSRLPGVGKRVASQIIAELKKVVTPTRSELVSYTIVVLVFVAVVMAFITGLDFVVGRLMLWLFASS